MFWIEYSNKSSQFICGHFMKNKKLIYFALPISLVLLSLVFEYLEDNGLIPEFNTLILYIYRYVTLFVVYLSIFGVFTFFKKKATFMQISLLGSMLLVLMDYYLNFASAGRSGILVNLPILFAIYITKYSTITEKH
ncbi:MAG: hypothetical protein IKU79_07190 [Bacteroidaceae bacterium]|jgi:hypothetical protein|nr:hypothetical protein [Bacteroidaceae bacterium]